MFLLEIKLTNYSRAKSFTIGEKNIFFFTGQRVIICDRELNIIKTIQGLRYVYRGILSPDETNLLMISNAQYFYTLSIPDFTLKKCIVRGVDNCNLEGRGCWSLDGKEVYLPVFNPQKGSSQIRIYKADFSYSYIELPRYRVIYINQETLQKQYFILGQDLNLLHHTLNDLSFLWYNGKQYFKYPIEDFEDAVLHIDFYESRKEIVIHGSKSSFAYNYQGKRISNVKIESQKNEIYDLIKLLINDNLNKFEHIQVVKYSINKKYLYIGTSSRLIIINIKTKEKICKNIEYGVEQISELDNDYILISTWNGIREFKIIEDD